MTVTECSVSGSSTTADINIIPTASGDLFGKFLVQYEDEYGEVYTTEKEFTAYVMEEMSYDEPVYDPSMDAGMMEPQNTGMSTGLKIGIGAAAAVVLVALIVLLRRHAKKKREKELAE